MSFLFDDHVASPVEHIRLPDPPEPSRPSPFPFIAAVVPVAGALGMWAVTGSALMLWFAALSPVMLLGAVVDRGRARRRDRRMFASRLADETTRARARLARRHDEDREARTRVHPSLSHLCAQPGEVWRAHPQRQGTAVVGVGSVDAPVDITGGGDAPDTEELRLFAGTLADAPIVVPLDGAIAVRGSRAVCRAVARALVLQICAVHPPDAWRVLPSGAHGWLGALPHATATSAARTLALREGDVPATDDRADITVHALTPSAPAPPGATTVIDLTHGLDAHVTRGSVTRPARVEAVSERQAETLAAALAARADRLAPPPTSVTRFADTSSSGRGSLGVVVGEEAGEQVWLDLVEDGPHAIVVGTTGAGKSEFLVTWVLAMCRSRRADEVTFMLADFKGGTAFEPLRALPQVAGVLTDLDPHLADRAVRSLASEVRRREAAIAGVGARDITDSRVDLPRLVVVVDEFPALLVQRPHLEPVFTDIAARGRALGIHLVLGGQRVSGVVREGLLANSPLRIALRVSDPAEARTLVGTDAPAALVGGASAAGVGFIRRAGDDRAQRARFSLTCDDDIAAVAGAHPPLDTTVRGPWLAPLATRIDVAEVRRHGGDVIGMADEPDDQRQPPVRFARDAGGIAVIGGARTGKTTALRTIASTRDGAIWLGSDPERAWDVLEEFDVTRSGMLVCDDLDSLLAAYPEPWSSAILARLDALVRRGGDSDMCVVVSVRSVGGLLGRIVDLVPQRLILALPGRTEHVAAGGQAHEWAASRPPGRGIFSGREMQIAIEDPPADGSDARSLVAGDVAHYAPAERVTGIVTRSSAERIRRATARWGLTALSVSDLPAGIDLLAGPNLLLVGDPEQWQRAWQVCDVVRREGELVVSVECATELRLITGQRTVPPFARAGRAWASVRGGPFRRVQWE